MKTATKTATRTRTAAKHLDTFKGINSALGATLKWPAAAGPVVTAEAVTSAAGLVKRNGTAKHLGLAMTLRPEGATQPEIIQATGDTQVNAFSEAARSGLAHAVEIGRRDGHKVYKLALGKPATKAKATRKRTAKAKAAEPAKAEQPAS